MLHGTSKSMEDMGEMLNDWASDESCDKNGSPIAYSILRQVSLIYSNALYNG